MSDFISGISNYYMNDYSGSATDLKSEITNTDFSKATDEELMEACKSFEQYFIEQAFKGMEKMIPENEDSTLNNTYVKMFKDTLYEEYAKSVTDRGDGIGIAKMLYEQMKRNYEI